MDFLRMTFIIFLFLLTVCNSQVYAQMEPPITQQNTDTTEGIVCGDDRGECSGTVACGTDVTFYSSSGEGYSWRLAVGGGQLSDPPTGNSVTLTAPTSNPFCVNNAILEMVLNVGTDDEVIVDSIAISYNCSTVNQAYVDVLTRASLCTLPGASCWSWLGGGGVRLYEISWPERPAYYFSCDGRQGTRHLQKSCGGGSGVHHPNCNWLSTGCAQGTEYCDEKQADLPLDVRTDGMKGQGCCPSVFFEKDMEANQ